MRYEAHIRNYISDNYHPAYADRIVSIGGSPNGKFFSVYIEIAPSDYHQIFVPTKPAASSKRRAP